MAHSLKEKLFFNRRFLLQPELKKFVAELSAVQQLNSEELRDLNWQRIRRIVQFAYENIPYYKLKYSSVGFEPGDLKTRKDFESLPVLEKDEIRENAELILDPAKDVNQLSRSTTGGTTGAPLATYSDPKIPIQAVSWRSLGWWGLSPSNNSGYLYRIIPVGIQKLLHQILLYPTRRTYLAASDMSQSRMHEFYWELVSVKAAYLVGYVGSLDIFARFLQENGYKLAGLRAVWTTAAPLPEVKRLHMQEYFGCPVYVQYGSCEFYWLACECERQCALHIASDIRHIDIVSGQETLDYGQEGDIVATDLLNFAFPLIRYRLGDRGRLLGTLCDCGLPFPLMDYVHGRISEAIKLPDGTIIPGEFWTTIFDEYSQSIRSFRVRQSIDYSIEVVFEPIGSEYSIAIAKVSENLENILKSRVPLKITKGSVDTVVGGKIQFVTSDVKDVTGCDGIL